jgi:hypothetical protein
VNHVNATLAISGEKQTNTSFRWRSGGQGQRGSKTFEERRRISVMLCRLMKGQAGVDALNHFVERPPLQSVSAQ